ncbi:MAG: phosphodiesterase, partial [Oscillospiraceae bacterium]|nr:phosphodiesterase [Oscillospiraceae bacterium]
MKLMIASDIHGSAFYCRKMLEAFKNEHADRLLLLGDILYHGPRNDLPKDYAPKEVISMLNGIKENILCVRGNCDTEVDQMVLEFPVLNEQIFLSIDGTDMLAVHGHKPFPAVKSGTVILSGHTHVPKIAQENGVIFINPGSVS